MFNLRYQDSMNFYDIVQSFLSKVWLAIFGISCVEVVGYFIAVFAEGNAISFQPIFKFIFLPLIINLIIAGLTIFLSKSLSNRIEPFFQIAIFLIAISLICFNLAFTHHDVQSIFAIFSIPILMAVLFIDKKPIIFATIFNISLYLLLYIFILPARPDSNIKPDGVKEIIVLLSFLVANYFFAQIACLCMINILDKFIEKHEESQLDSLTKLFNHESFYKRLDRYIFSYKTNNILFSLIVWDIDNFKSVNDQYGHDVGDEVILAMVEAINYHLSRGDNAFRYGGEELTLLTCKDARSAKMLSEQIRRTFSEYCQTIEGIDRIITASAGICEFDSEHFRGPKDFFSAADEALYKAKGTPGKNTDIIWTAYKNNNINFNIN